MTQLNTAIRFNSSTGSDTAASGVGPATAVTGNGASTTASSAVVTGISTTGVTAGDLLYVQSSSGRQFSVIASVDSGTQVTCDDTFTNTESGRAWAIGGKRATFDNASSRRIFDTDSASDFVIETETDQTVSSMINVPRAATIRGANETLRTITQTADDRTFEVRNANTYKFLYLKFDNTSVSKTSADGIGLEAGNPYVVAYKCVFGDSVNQLRISVLRVNNTPAARLKNCVIQHCTGSGISATYMNAWFGLDGCLISNNGVHGVVSSTLGNGSIRNCIFANNTNYGVYSSHASSAILFNGNIFWSNGDGGVNVNNVRVGFCNENIFVDNGGYGITFRSAHHSDFLVGNSFYNNTSGEISGLTGVDSITLTADPFVDAANGDFNLNADAGGGAVLRSNNYTVGG